ncbi:uncharacterized protein LOC6614375 isoform X1 [Drosophila sechellia]|uniref:uncharacterized protein LOC6614375 isoform X1 n=1 Tax=Drosophila sechellia TaxID=7238 RepID=UPI0013DE2EE7|nr:uncharacterized protein LOC6614375 isoform X1 [Drosophila sechellia]
MNYNYNNSYNYNYICSTTSPNNNSNHRSRNNEGREQDTQQHQHPQPHQQPMQAALRTASLSSSSNASSSTSTSKTRAGITSLIYLPPFCYPCKHVPAAGTTTRSRSQTLSHGSGSCQDSSCCCPPGWEHKNYDKHASAATLTPATAAVGAAGAGGTTTATASIITTTGPAAATMSSSWSGEFLLPGIQLPVAAAGHSCADLRQTSQLVMPTVASGDVVEVDAEGGVLECGKRCWRRERIRREGPSHASAASLAQVNPISTSNSTSISTSPATTIDGASGAGAVVPTTAHNSQTTTKTTARGTTGAALPHDEENENDECRCFNYNGDISLDRRGEAAELSGITWLMFLWQHLLPGNGNNTPKLIRAHTHTHESSFPAGTTTKTARSRSCAMTSTKSWLGPLLMLLLATSVSGWGGRQDAPTNCTFPARWEGSWFLSGYQQSIHIKGSQFSYRGRCAASDGNKYLIVDEKGCHRCLVIYEKHKNVLQYKESECEGDSMYMHQSNPSALAMRSSNKQSDHRGGAHPNTNGHSRLSSSDQYIMRSNDDMNDCPPDFCKGRETLQNLCDQIPGDALLYSLFRESAEPVKCPLKGPFIFTYNRGHGECKSPVSNIESCTEESRLLLSFQACPDVQGTESTVEELTCLATWKDGNSRYLVGLVSHHHAISNEERYRCFVYEKISSLMGGPSMLSSKDAEYKLAQSGDATCNGLDSAEVGSRIMSLRKPPIAERCDFPAWFKGPRHWHALMGNAVYNYHSNDGSVHIIKPNGYMETRALCEQINKQTPTEMMAVVHYTTGCQSGFMCMMFYRRDTFVIEIQTGKPAIRLEDACAPDHFDINKMAYITLLASNPDLAICPMEGIYSLRGAIGPPYLATRHKRNHNGKSHLGHGHHHHEGADSGNFGHKGHSSLSFRNAERMERGSWHANTRGLPVRSRRNAPKDPQEHQQQQQEALVLEKVNSSNTSVGFVATRNRRDVPGCVPNYNAQRQLWVGCTAENLIDVSPLCSVDGEEEYSCHGSWSENSTFYIIARHKGSKHGVCLTYRPTEGTAAKLVVGDACYRGTQKPPDHHLEANLSVLGKCGETGASAAQVHLANWLLLVAMASWLQLHS